MGILNLFKLDSKVAVVTGAGKGIGRGIALALAEAGADIAVTARTQNDLEKVAHEIRDRGRRAFATTSDVTKLKTLEHLAKQTVDELGVIDIWVNNAGGIPDFTPRALADMTEEQFDAQTDLNLRGVWAGCAVAAGAMKAKGGCIINISALGARHFTNPSKVKAGAYFASKAAVNNLTANFALELAPKIRVNAVAPGAILTPAVISTMKRPSEESQAALLKTFDIPLERWGTVEEIGALVVYLASPAGSWVTGETYYITGGA
jgi:7-alpha-hydroxysteroid dehydrogenase